MMLSTHALAGAAVATIFPQSPVLAFAAGFASHFVLDAVPHKDYGLRSFVGDKTGDPLKADIVVDMGFLPDLAKIGADALIGLAIGIFIFETLSPTPFRVLFAGAVGGMLPDALQFVYFKSRSKLLEPLQRFHRFVHTSHEPEIGTGAAIALQAAFSVVVVFAALWFLGKI